MRDGTLAELLGYLRERISADMRVSLPGRIESYDAGTQLVSVKPQVRDFTENSEGGIDQHSLPIINNVPLVFPGAGGYRLTFPVSVGDPVLLIFADRSIDSWTTNGQESAPADLRTHHIADAIAVPGLRPQSQKWNGVDTSVITLGSDSGNADFVALSTPVANELADLRATLNALIAAFNAHTHSYSWTGSPGSGSTGGSGSVSSKDPIVSVASATVKIKG